VELKGEANELWNKLTKDQLCDSNPSAKQALEELKLLFEYLECYGMLDKIEFDLSLARGLDYYTGVIYEAVLTDKKIGVGSIAAGGRYDGLVGIFGGSVPAVGFSVGVERIFSLIENKIAKSKEAVRITETEVFVASFDKEMIKERMKICKELWNAGIKAELLPRASPKIQAQLKYAGDNNIPFAVVFGDKELQSNTLLLKDLNTAVQEVVARQDLATILKDKLAKYYSNLSPSATKPSSDKN